MKTIIKVKAGTFNIFCSKLESMMIDVEKVKSAGCRSKFWDRTGNVVAAYDERKGHGIVYNYNTHSDLVGKELRF